MGFDQWGGVAHTYISEALSVNIPEDSKYYGSVDDGDFIMATHVAYNVFSKRYFLIPINLDGSHYTDIPMAHVIGKFENNKISFPSFKPIMNYLVTETVKDVDNVNGVQLAIDPTLTVQKVLKVGPKVPDISEGDIILVRDNIMTSVWLDDKEYNALNYDMVVGLYKKDCKNYKLENIERLIGSYVIMEAAQAEFACESTMILNPNYDIDNDKDCMSEVWTDRYQVIYSNIDELKPNDIIFVPREALNYVTLHGTKYYVAYDKDFMLARITGD